jgi:outer membrane protein TolC
MLFFVMGILTFMLYSPEGVMAQEESGEAIDSINENTVELPLKDIIVLALKNNLEIAIASLSPGITETDIMREESVYDPNFYLQFGKDRSVIQTGNFLAGAGEDSIWQQNWNLDVDVMKRFVTGTSAELRWNTSESKTDFLFQQLVPQYKSELNLSLTQPLLKDFGTSVGKSMISIANLNFKISESQFKNQVMDIIYQIQNIYWNIYFQREDYKARASSLKAAENLLREFKIRIDAGTLAPIEIYEAEATVAERRQDLIVVWDLLKDQEDRLKRALNFYERQTDWDITIVPADEPRFGPVTADLTESLKEAFAYRPDYNQAKMDIEARNIMVKYTKNQTLPRVDLFGTIGTMGLAGRGNPDAASFFGGGGEGSFTATHWDDVADSMASGDFYNYAIGVKIEFPFGNRFAKSQYSRAKIESARAATFLKDLENNVINEVRETLRQVETDIRKVEAGRASLRLAKERLAAEEKKYEVGLTTTYVLLEYQSDLATAESRYALSRADYEKDLANFARAKGVLLEEYNIAIE